MIYTLIYLSIGLGFYIAISIARHFTFRNTSLWAKTKGFIFGVVFWPFIMIYLNNNRYSIFGGDIVRDMEEDALKKKRKANNEKV